MNTEKHSQLGKQIIESLEQAVAYERGEYTPVRVHRVPVSARNTSVAAPPRYDASRVRAVRRRLGLSQELFAGALAVSTATIRAWEQGSRHPEGATRRLLQMAEEHPEYISEQIQALGGRVSPVVSDPAGTG